MDHEANLREKSAHAGEEPSITIDSSDRRSFMKGTLTAAAATAGGLAASVASAREAQANAPGASKKIAGVVHAHFSSTKQPTLEDVQAVVRQIVGRGGCPTCGLGGIDVRLSLGDPVEIQAGVPVTVLAEKAE
jgi:hypothetical protein